LPNITFKVEGPFSKGETTQAHLAISVAWSSEKKNNAAKKITQKRRDLWFEAIPGKWFVRPCLKNTQHKERTGGVAQVV
jgi:hypothetical protein